MENDVRSSGRVQAIVAGGLAVAVLDAVDALVAYKLAYGMSPVVIYQFVASGLLGKAAYAGGATGARSGSRCTSSSPSPRRRCSCSPASGSPACAGERWGGAWSSGSAVFVVMNLVVIPLSRIGASLPPLPLVANGVLGHALLVGLPIALAARRFLGSPAPRRTHANGRERVLDGASA